MLKVRILITVSKQETFCFSISHTVSLHNDLGSLFIAKRSKLPRFKIVVMNRNSKNNLDVPLSSNFQMQINEPYLIFRSDKDEGESAQAIWFHDSGERQNICDVLQRIVKSLSYAQPIDKFQSNSPIPTKEIAAKMNNEEAAASLMAALRIGGSSQNLKDQEDQKPSSSEITDSNETRVENQNIILDKKTLQLTLMSLLQDDRFIDLIHAKYLTIAKARAGSSKK
jgi:mRNA-decapping enzyme 1B